MRGILLPRGFVRNEGLERVWIEAAGGQIAGGSGSAAAAFGHAGGPFRLGIERYGTSALFTVFVPAFVIVLITMMGQWMPFESMDIRSNAGAPMLAAAVLFHFALMQ